MKDAEKYRKEMVSQLFVLLVKYKNFKINFVGVALLLKTKHRRQAVFA